MSQLRKPQCALCHSLLGDKQSAQDKHFRKCHSDICGRYKYDMKKVRREFILNTLQPLKKDKLGVGKAMSKLANKISAKTGNDIHTKNKQMFVHIFYNPVATNRKRH